LGEDGYIFARKFTIILESITLQDEQQLRFPFAERMKLNPDCDPDNSDLLKDLPYSIMDKIRGNPKGLFYRHTELADFQGYQNQTLFSEDGCIISEVGVYGHIWQITSSDILSYKGFNIRCIDGGTQIGWAYMYGYSSKDRQLQNSGDLLMTANETIYAGKYTYKHIKELYPYRELNQEEDLPFQLGRVLPESGIRNPNRDQEGYCIGKHECARADLIKALQRHAPWDYGYCGDEEIYYLSNNRHSVELDLLYLRALPFYARFCNGDSIPVDANELWYNYAYRIIQAEYPPELLPKGIIRDTILNLYYQYPSRLPDYTDEFRRRFRDR
jgi:hypothetical protein